VLLAWEHFFENMLSHFKHKSSRFREEDFSNSSISALEFMLRRSPFQELIALDCSKLLVLKSDFWLILVWIVLYFKNTFFLIWTNTYFRSLMELLKKHVSCFIFGQVFKILVTFFLYTFFGSERLFVRLNTSPYHERLAIVSSMFSFSRSNSIWVAAYDHQNQKSNRMAT